MEKMKMETPNLTEQNIEKIAELFPNCVTEGKDENGQLKKLINFDMLKQMLSDSVIEGKEVYEFTWPGKKEAIIEANTPIRKTLRPCTEESKNWGTTENLYIEGDNLEVLKLLQESYLGKVKMIYIDPPYNTGNDFIYNDKFDVSNAIFEETNGYVNENGTRMVKNSSLDGRYHSKWCSMIYSRLLLARNLLSDDGVIFISIDYNENSSLRKIMDEIFGSEHFVGEIYWESKTKSQNTLTSYNKLQPKIEMILVYSKMGKPRFNLIEVGKKEYPYSDQKGSYREYILEEMSSSGIRGRETMIFDIKVGENVVKPNKGKQWKLGKEQIRKYQISGDLFIRNGKVVIKIRPENEKTVVTEPFWGFFPKEIGTAESGKKELKKLIGETDFETVKPVEVIRRLLYHSTNKNDIIIDFFSGSATTAEATMKLNYEDGGTRKFILVQYPEEYEQSHKVNTTDYNSICEIGKERIRCAGEKIKSEHPGAKDLDIGFRVLKVDSSNMNNVYYSPDDYTQSLLDHFESNIKKDRSSLDLLFSCLLDWGLPLSLPYTSEQIDGFTIHNYNDGDLIACFDENISDSVIKVIANQKPLRAVFRDSSFESNPSKINVSEIFKMLSPDTIVKVI